MARVEEEMTCLFELAGDVEESPQYIERVLQTIPVFDRPHSRLAPRRVWRWVWRPRRVAAMVLALALLTVVLWWNPLRSLRKGTEGTVFADMMARFTAHDIFHTRGQITRYDPATGERHTQVFEKWLQRVPDAPGLRWRQRVEILNAKKKVFYGMSDWEEDSVNFPHAVYRTLEMKGKRVERSQLFDLRLTDSMTERLLWGIPFLTRSAAEALARHPEARITMERPSKASQRARLRVTLRDTQGSALTCIFWVNLAELLPQRVEVRYARGGRVYITSTYTVEYPDSVPPDLFSVHGRRVPCQCHILCHSERSEESRRNGLRFSGCSASDRCAQNDKERRII